MKPIAIDHNAIMVTSGQKNSKFPHIFFDVKHFFAFYVQYEIIYRILKYSINVEENIAQYIQA